MSFYRVYYHLVWTTKYRSPLLTVDTEPMVHELLRSKAIQLGAHVHALNGTENHVHMIATIPPSLAVAEFVRQVKGLSTFKVNRLEGRSVPFGWQAEFGVFSFDAKRLPNHVLYVERQKEHHAANQLVPILERTEESLPPTLHESPPLYSVIESNWWDEMRAMG